MKINRDYIVSKAFEQYLLRGYSGVSISVLQEQLGIGRATLYYYFKDKSALFCAVIDKYFVNALEQTLDMPDTVLLSQMLESRMDLLHNKCAYLHTVDNPQVVLANYSSMLLVAMMKYTGFREKIDVLRQRTISLWTKAIRNSMVVGEVRADINVEVVASFFVNIKDSYESGWNTNFVDDARFVETSYKYLYDLIKV
ncbi:MAG: TetR/AcrR family transcriptional regulator [Paludibacteraceae bacterium]